MEEFVFVGNKKQGEIDYADKLFYVQKNGSEFVAPVALDRKELESKKSFPFGLSDCIFHSTVIIEDCIFKGDVSFADISIKDSSFEIRDCNFGGILNLCDTVFDNTELHITDCTIAGRFLFGNVRITDEGVFIVSSTFKDYALFEEGVFNCSIVDFSETVFEGQTIMRDMRFEHHTYFNQIQVKQTLIFTGLKENRIFHGYTEFSIPKEHIHGQITFQDVNISHIIDDHRKTLFEMEYAGKVVIGRGCIKYRLQTEPLVLDISENNQILIEEITRGFTHFFTNHTGHNLGIEIQDRTETSITIFYFSNENLTQQEFDELLVNNRGLFLSLFGNIKKIFEQKGNENYLINGINGIVSLLSICLRTTALITIGQWKEKDTRALLDCVQGIATDNAATANKMHEVLSQMNLPTVIQKVINENELNIINFHQINQHGKNPVYIENNEGEVTKRK